jgi:hypothetical protein
MPKSERDWDQQIGAGYLRLRERFSRLPAGRVADPEPIIVLLQACWRDFDGSAEENTTAAKLWRAEDLTWQPPMLTFALPRHGAAPAGAASETLHDWEIDIDTQTATLAARRQRPIKARRKRPKA